MNRYLRYPIRGKHAIASQYALRGVIHPDGDPGRTRMDSTRSRQLYRARLERRADKVGVEYLHIGRYLEVGIYVGS